MGTCSSPLCPAPPRAATLGCDRVVSSLVWLTLSLGGNRTLKKVCSRAPARAQGLCRRSSYLKELAFRTISPYTHAQPTFYALRALRGPIPRRPAPARSTQCRSFLLLKVKRDPAQSSSSALCLGMCGRPLEPSGEPRSGLASAACAREHVRQVSQVLGSRSPFDSIWERTSRGSLKPSFELTSKKAAPPAFPRTTWWTHSPTSLR